MFNIESFEIKPFNDALYRNKENAPILDSLDTNPIIKYPNAYYFEWQDDQYLQNLFLTFRHECIDLDRVEFSDWTAVRELTSLDKDIYDMYQDVYQFLINKLNSSPYMKLRNSDSIQIIHNVLNRYRRSATYIQFDIDVLLYREAKFTAKHVNMIIAYDISNDEIIVVGCSIKGNVSEGTFYLFPVTANDPLQPNHHDPL